MHYALCLPLEDDKILHVPLFQRNELAKSHTKNGQASPTPVVDDAVVYVHFAASGTACLTSRHRS